MEGIIFVITWFLAIFIAYGVRTIPAGVASALGSLGLVLVSIFFTLFSDFSKLHLLWVFPLAYVLFGFGYGVLASITSGVFWKPLSFVAQVYTRIVRLGVSKERQEQLNQQLMGNINKWSKELAEQKREEINKSKK